jgi:hypothetical protein
MNDTKPRDLTLEELALLQLPAFGGSASAPLRIPPGTQVAIEKLNPVAEEAAATASPSGGPNDAHGPGASGASPDTATG